MIYSFHSCFLERYYQRKILQRLKKKSVSLFECIFILWNGDCMLLITGAEAFLHLAFDCVSTREKKKSRWNFKHKTQPWNTALLNNDIRQVRSWEFLSFSLFFWCISIFLFVFFTRCTGIGSLPCSAISGIGTRTGRSSFLILNIILLSHLETL